MTWFDAELSHTGTRSQQGQMLLMVKADFYLFHFKDVFLGNLNVSLMMRVDYELEYHCKQIVYCLEIYKIFLMRLLWIKH